MRKIISFTASIVFLMAFTAVNAQEYTFRVLVNKGSNKIQRAAGGTPEALKTGSKLFENDQVIASAGAYIGLMHKSGKTTEIKEPGTKKVSELAKTINVAGTSTANRYARFVANKMNQEENTNYRSRLNATGAVSRAVGDAAINVLAPEQAEVLGERVIVRWRAPKEAEEGTAYTVKVKNIFDDVIFQDETTETFVELNFADPEMKNDAGLYLVTVYKSDDEEIASSEVGIKKVKASDKSDIQEGLTDLKNEVSGESPLDKLIFASYYEENGLFLDALTQYEDAISQSPDIEDFKSMYQEFLYASGLEEEETKEEGE